MLPVSMLLAVLSVDTTWATVRCRPQHVCTCTCACATPPTPTLVLILPIAPLLFLAAGLHPASSDRTVTATAVATATAAIGAALHTTRNDDANGVQVTPGHSIAVSRV